MRAEKIPAHESRFDNTGKDSAGKKHALIKKSIEIFGEDKFLNYVDIEPASGDESYYYRTKFPKDQIVIHYTMGYLKGDIATLTKHDYHVSVAFVIGRNGTIYNLFPSAYWSYHLGRGAKGGNGVRSKRSIGIEISNIGPLIRKGNNLATAYKDRNGNYTDIYCSSDQQELWEAKPFRGFDFYATQTNQQYESLIILLRYLTARYEIPRQFLDENVRYEASTPNALFNGIVSHVNYRATGKTDIGPAFDWNRVIEGVTS